VLIMRSDSVFEQLKGLGVQKEKIISFYDLGEFLGINSEVNVLGKKVLFSDWVKDKRNVLIVCHELTRNGVSVVLMHTAILLRKMGYHVVLSGLIGGGLEQEPGQLGIDFISDISVCYRSKKFRDVALKMDFIILGTVGLADVANTFRETEVPVLLWMHESNDINFCDFIVPTGKNIHYFAGGQRVIEKFQQYYPQRDIEKLLYFLPDETLVKNNSSEKLKIAVIGIINYRKAQDVFVSAIRNIPKAKRENISFELVGVQTEAVIDIEQVTREIPEIHYIGELNQYELKRYFAELDILVCSSRDDPMPVVVTQAMQYGIPCIVSDQTGQSEYINNGENGFVFKSEDIKELTRLLMFCIDNKDNMRELGSKSSEIYEKFFSERTMENNLYRIIAKYC